MPARTTAELNFSVEDAGTNSLKSQVFFTSFPRINVFSGLLTLISLTNCKVIHNGITPYICTFSQSLHLLERCDFIPLHPVLFENNPTYSLEQPQTSENTWKYCQVIVDCKWPVKEHWSLRLWHEKCARGALKKLCWGQRAKGVQQHTGQKWKSL